MIGCPLCNSSAEFFINNSYYDLFRCVDCNLVFAHPIPTTEQLKNFYKEDYYIFKDIKLQKKRALLHYQLVNRIVELNKDLSILDIGAANGDFLEMFPRKHNLFFNEISSQRAYNLKKKGFNEVSKNFDKEKISANIKFDIITCWDIIEHLTDINTFFKNIARLMKSKNFYLFIETPNINSTSFRLAKKYWIGFNKFHLLFFSKKNLQLIKDKYGFREIRLYSNKNSLSGIIFNSLTKRFDKIFEGVQVYNKMKHLIKNNRSVPYNKIGDSLDRNLNGDSLYAIFTR